MAQAMLCPSRDAKERGGEERMDQRSNKGRPPKLTVHVNDLRADATLRTPAHHLKRAVRALRHGWFRARRELKEGVGRASTEVRNAAASLREGWRLGR